jgi:hypothetical protein
VSFPVGSLTATVTVDPTADTTVEADETVSLTVTAGTGYTVGAPSSATGTITNDDTEVSVAYLLPRFLRMGRPISSTRSVVAA